ncbi:MAG: hypothetical protein Q4A34_03005 [Candidatus Saccharibacteria bacterium]|nr:hypothetical protein [Candidatus Saccharibacteria bacterium]
MSGSMEGILPGAPYLPAAQEPGNTIEFGPKFLASVTFNDINELPQIRRRYDDEELEELADSMCHIDENGNATFDLYNPPVIAKLTAEEARQYVEGHGRLFPESGDAWQKFDSLTLAEDGYYYVLIAGHRRKRAIHITINKHGLSSDTVSVISSIREGIPFEEALLIQFRENKGVRPDPEDVAQEIRNYHTYLTTVNPAKKPTIAYISAQTGETEHVVRSALRFTSLPECVQQLVSEDRRLLPYSVAVKLAPLADKVRELYDKSLDEGQQFAESKDEYVAHQTYAMAPHIIRYRIDGEKRIDDYIRNMLKDYQAKIDGVQQAFELLTEVPRALSARKAAETGLARAATGALGIVAPENLPDDVIAQLKAITAAAEAAARSINEQQETLMF